MEIPGQFSAEIDNESKTNNTADAYVLACMGLAHANRLKGVTLDQRTIVGNVKLNSV
jgi:hypothetical protein